VIGLAGGLLLLCGDPWWKALLTIWSLAQAAVIIVDPSGELTRQPFYRFTLLQSSATTTGGLVTELRGYGVNAVGLVLAVLIQWIRVRRWYPDVPSAPWQYLLLRLVRLGFAGVCCLAAAWFGWHWGPLYAEKDRLAVLDSPLPGAEAYIADRKLGRTPLVITHQRLVEWGLSRPEGAAKGQLVRNSLENGFLLSGNRSSTNVLLRPPAWCARAFESFQSEWGPRGLILNDTWGDGRRARFMGCRHPGWLLSLPEGLPQSVAAGKSFPFVARLRHNPPDPRATGPASPTTGPKAEILVTFLQGSHVFSRRVSVPDAWRSAPVGGDLRATLEAAAPERPGRYEVRLSFAVYADAAGVKRVDTGRARTYGFIEIK